MQRLDVYAEVGKPLGAECPLELWLLTPERDLHVLDTLRPHLVQLWRNARLRRPATAGLLTPREREILAWVARGKTNREIAAVDNVYAKLSVGSRAGAVARIPGLKKAAKRRGCTWQPPVSDARA